VVAAVSVVLLVGCGDRRPSERQLLSEGRRVFVSARCGVCHTVASAHTHGQVGSDFDTSEQLGRDQIRTELDYGDGVMPSYRDRLTARQRDAVVEFVFQTLRQRR
jgi:mono/diheme cytochrome c family protein